LSLEVEAEYRRRKRAKLPLLDFVPALSSGLGYTSPNHLARIASVFERIKAGEAVRVVFNGPPRHGKTSLIHHVPAWLLSSEPGWPIAYISYAQTFAENQSRDMRDLALRAGVRLATDTQSKQYWRTEHGKGGLWATSIDGPLTGMGFRVMLLDDIIKDRKTAESAVAREHHWEWVTGTAFTRLEPGASILATGTRWHTDDVLGRLIELGWEVINLPAIDDEGLALWPERYDAEALTEIRRTVGEYNWWSQYMGQPVPRSGKVFADCVMYNERPKLVRVAIGVDFAYSARSSADYSCAVVLGVDAHKRYYVLKVHRAQVEASEFASVLARLRTDYPAARLSAYVAGPEKGIVQLFGQRGVRITPLTASEDKLTRAQPVAAEWNAGNVLVPEQGAWVSDFIDEVTSFSGTKQDVHDDQVDALAGAFAGLAASPITYDREIDDLLLARR
jgi:predicted phage terminase large subunit-like protein